MSTKLNSSEVLSQSLFNLTYNGSEIKVRKDQKLNIYMGIGLWSVKDGLSLGLPVDVMNMLLSAVVLRAQILEANPNSQSKVILLIADSMAIDEGAEESAVCRIVSLYKSSLDPLLELVHLKECSEIVLSSELNTMHEYQTTQKSIEEKKQIQELVKDKVHYAYIRTQSTITHYMCEKKGVGFKVGWLLKHSNEERILKKVATSWDERQFDCIYDAICPESSLQYLYAKAGLKQRKGKGNVSIVESCPYTSYKDDNRYTVQLNGKLSLEKICPVKKAMSSHWKGIAEACSKLIEINVLENNALPEGCIRSTNLNATVFNMLNHWINCKNLIIQKY